MTAGFDAQGLRRKRKARRMTLAALGQELGVTHQAVSRWEQGHTTPTIDLLPDLAAALDCRIDDLFSPAVGAAR